MSVASLSQDLYGFAIELRKLAYTMPGGQEDPLIRLSERMAQHARRVVADESQSATRPRASHVG
jgi:hypothetical protein